MSPVLTLENPPQLTKSTNFSHPFLQEFIKQIRLADTFGKFNNLTDELLIEQLIIASDKEIVSPRNLNLDPINQLVIHAFYGAIGVNIEQKTGHSTELFINLKGREFSSAVISCGGVIVLYSLIWGYKNFGFISIKELIESAENYIRDAITKASLYLDFVY